VAFLLAVFLLILPTQADSVAELVQNGRFVPALAIVVATITAVVAPQAYAEWQTRAQPEKYQPRLLSKITWAIVALNLVLNTLMFTACLTRARAQ
jgi:hypothetical protein